MSTPHRLASRLVMHRLALATSQNFSNLNDDDRLLLQPLAHRGILAEAAVWSDPNYDWKSCDMVVIRSCWDYHLRLPEFLRWIDSLEHRGVRVWNRPATLRWNADKVYLRDLERRGVPIVPTLWFESERAISLKHELQNAGWGQAVVKPRVSATAYRTKLVRADYAEEAQELLDELRDGPGVMVQKFMDGIVCEGEWSLIFFGGKFSHAVLKKPKSGDFRVQHDFGGLEEIATPPAFVLAAAERIMLAAGETLYARVDGVIDNGEFRLMELELIEPALFLLRCSGAAERFAEAIVASLSG